MLAKTLSFSLFGIEAYPIEIEVDVSRGLPTVTMVGLADTAIKESKERVKTAIKNSGFSWPAERITINLAPSDIKKEGSGFDLAIALGVLAATSQFNGEFLKNYYILGELSLDGSLRPVKGMLSVSLAISQSTVKNLIVPSENAHEATLVNNINIFCLGSLKEAVEFLNSPESIKPIEIKPCPQYDHQPYPFDFQEIKGQFMAKRAMEVAVTGAHNLLMSGPPGSGKTMLAKRIPTIMPNLSLEEALEVRKIHSIAGEKFSSNTILALRPFRSPHHTSSHIALIGGGSLPQPGEISLAHHGVLFLDEFPEFNRASLEALRQPLEERSIRITRIQRSITFPASFMLVCAMNPCPCGYYTDPRRTCSCGTHQIQRYLNKISGPLLDRIDIHIELPSIKFKELTDTKETESSAIIKTRVEEARTIQRERFKTDRIFYNAQMNTKLIKKYCVINDAALSLLKQAMTELGISARAYDKILKVSRTIADLGKCEVIEAEHIAEAVQYRNLDKM